MAIDCRNSPDTTCSPSSAVIFPSPCISAASILAKEYRDRQMLELDRLYPQYCFAQHKGYPTALHRELLKKHGVSPVHRRSFRPVRELLP